MGPEDLLSTPSGYATPEQLASVKQYADLLMKGGQRDQPITHPLQGVRMMADALGGGMMRNQMGQMGQGNRNLDASGLMGVVPNPPGGPQASGGQGGLAQMASLGGAQAPAQSGNGYGGLPPEIVNKIRNTEGFDPKAKWDVRQPTYGYGARAPAVGASIDRSGAEELLNRDLSQATALVDQVNPRLDPGTRAALADLTFNTGIGWSKSGLGQAVRAGDTNAIKQHLLQYVNVAGQPNQAIANRRQMDAGWIGQPGAQVAQAGPTPQGGSPPPVGSPQAMSGALAATGARAPNVSPPLSQYGSPGFGPEYATQRPKIDPQKLQQLLSSPTLDPNMKASLYQLYLEQYQPLDVKTTGGHAVFPYGKPGIEIPDLQKFEEKAGDAATTTFGTVTGAPGGGTQFRGTQGASGIGGQQSGSPPDFSGLPPIHPPAAKPVGPQGSIAPPSTSPVVASAAPGGVPATAAQVASPMGQQASAGAGAKTALAVPGNTASDAPPIGGMLGTPPPQMAQARPPAGPQVAQASDAGGRLGALRDFSLNMKKQGELNTDDVKKYTENSNATMEAGKQATQGLPLIKAIRQAVTDPKFYSGSFADSVLDFKRLKAAVGSDPNAAAAMEIFEKGRAGDILNQLKAKLQGLGQVRLAEINLLDRASPNLHNTPQGNLALLQILEKAYDQSSNLSRLAAGYAGGARLDPKGNYVPAKAGDLPTNAGLNTFLQEYLRNNPLFDEKQIKEFNKTFDLEDKKPEEPATYTNSKAGQPVQAPPAGGLDLNHPDTLKLLLDEKGRRGP